MNNTLENIGSLNIIIQQYHNSHTIHNNIINDTNNNNTFNNNNNNNNINANNDNWIILTLVLQ